MLDNIKSENILFIDIETVPLFRNYVDVPEKLKKFWDKKSKYFRKDNENAGDVYQRAGIYAEFGKIICISVANERKIRALRELRIKSFYGDNEALLLNEFVSLLNNSFNKDDKYLCAHNGKEFDFPYIARRCLINGIKLPKMLDLAGKKPWEVKHLDTMELWKFGDYKHYTSLALLTEIFGIPTPKDDIDGSDVSNVFYENNDIDRIVTYCEKDTIAVAQLFQRYCGKPLFANEEIVITGKDN